VPEGRPGEVGDPRPGSLDPRWIGVGALALTVTASYGVLLYAFPVLLPGMEAELGWSRATLTGGFTVAGLATAAAAIPMGRWVDRFGPRPVMTIGSVAAVLLVIAWSRATTPLGYYLTWGGLGVASAAVQYEPAFAAVAQWFRRSRARALWIITVAGGLASTIFVPLTAWLLLTGGWRHAVLWLAGVLVVCTVLPHALLLPAGRIAPEAHESEGAAGAGGPASPNDEMTPRAALRSPSFGALTAAFALSAFLGMAVIVHFIPLLLERGHTWSLAGGALAGIGVAKLLGRLTFAPLLARTSSDRVALGYLGAQLLGVLLLWLVPGVAGVWAFVVLFGMGDGALTPTRAELMVQYVGLRDFGAITGGVAVVLAGARGLAPLAGSVAYGIWGGYGLTFPLAAGTLLASAALLGVAGRLRPSAPSSVYRGEGRHRIPWTERRS
jgi:hypothetical protein